MNTFFSRHAGDLAIDDDALHRLKQDNRVAIHYPWVKGSRDEDPDTESLNPDDYETSGKKALGAMLDLARHGGYVCATYRHTGTAVVGKVLPNARIELLRERWSTNPSRSAVLKTLSFESAIEVPRSKQALLLSMAPQQSTFSRWHVVGDKIQRLVEGMPWPMDLGSLHSTYQEVLCAEFLRVHDRKDLPRLQHLLLPVGRTMKGIDIFGFADDGKPLLAQVTYGRSNAKLRSLAAYGEDGTNHLIYFCEANEIHKAGHVTIVPMQVAFREFCATASGRRWHEGVHSFL